MEPNLLTTEKFEECITRMREKSDEIFDGWQLLGDAGARYLSKRVIRNFPSESSTNGTILNFAYHIVYNLSFSVPQLCMNIEKADGSLIQLDDSLEYVNLGETDLYTSFTQMDHPVLQRPFLTLHPCKTGEVLGAFSNSKNPVVSWLSSIGPTVQLSIGNEYACLTHG